MKKFHFKKGVRTSFWRVSRIISALLVVGQISLLQHFYILNQQVSAVGVDSVYIQKLLADRSIENYYLTANLVFMGDVMLDRSIGSAIESGVDPFTHIKSTIKSYDARIANIETTIADPSYSQQANKTYTFNSPLSALQTLKNAGIDMSSLANNHTGDFGKLATLDTISQFKNVGLQSFGAGSNLKEAFEAKILEINGISVAFIGVNDIELQHTRVSDGVPGSAYLNKDLISQSIQTAKANGAEVVIIMPHWGTEYSLNQNTRQTEWGHFMIDAGADLVVGSHPHVIQPTENYKGKQIVYSLGNFIFDGMSGDARNSQMISVELNKSVKKTEQKVLEKNTTVSPVISIPVTINDRGFPKLK